eukprot:scaffold262819_cov53-Prasinocladus_malaysianus.AAC.1
MRPKPPGAGLENKDKKELLGPLHDNAYNTGASAQEYEYPYSLEWRQRYGSRQSLVATRTSTVVALVATVCCASDSRVPVGRAYDYSYSHFYDYRPATRR